MRRMIAGAKKAIHRNKSQVGGHQVDTQRQNLYWDNLLDTLQGDQVQIDRSLFDRNVRNLTFSRAGPPGGYTCWDDTQCGLCSCFQDPLFMSNLFTKRFHQIGNVSDLLTWSQAGLGCSLCTYISMQLIINIQETEGGQLPMNADFTVRCETTNTVNEQDQREGISSFVFEISWGFPHGKAKQYKLNCFTTEEQVIGNYIPTRPANLDICSPAAFEKANTWLADCVEKHEQCHHTSSGRLEMPTRLLEISTTEQDDYSLRLHKSDEVIPYATLSYIWGGPQPFQTMKHNVDERIQEIIVKNLPKTILDAVRCTQRLGLRYLWVDSLCIIQDSLEDKGAEISRMSSIYKNSQVTICAASAINCEEGFLKPKLATEDLLKSSFKLQVVVPMNPIALNINPLNRADSNNSLSTIWLAAKPLGDKNGKDLLTSSSIQSEPISKRGWVLQESWLSTRMLVYGSGQLQWKCKQGIQVDGGLPSSWPYRNLYRTGKNGKLVNFDGSEMTEFAKDLVLSDQWRNIVEECSRRKLTVAADKLDAIEGIVQEHRRQSGDKYFAGLWKRRLISGLAWYQDARNLDSDSLNLSSERISPSWSWIKVDGPVRFSHAENSSAVLEDCEMLTHETTGTYPNSKLEVRGALKVRAPMSTLHALEALPHFQLIVPGAPRRVFTNEILPDGSLTNPYFTVVDGKQGASFDIRFLELSRGKSDGRQNIANESRGLILAPATDKRSDLFRRVGYFIVALEEDLEWSHVSNLQLRESEPRNVRASAFGEAWKQSLKEEVVCII